MIRTGAQIEKLLASPKIGITLNELAIELNELARLRDNARLAFCQRLAVVYLILVGHPPRAGNINGRRGGPGGLGEPFYRWCATSIRSARGKAYSSGTLGGYLRVGFAKNPQKMLERHEQVSEAARAATQRLGYALKHAVKTVTPPKSIPITRLRTEHKLPTDVATEVNRLMTAWEQASPTARAQFIYMVTGKRLAA